MTNRKNLLLLFLIFILLFIGFNLIALLQKESVQEISFADVRTSIGPFLTAIAIFISYRIEIKKEKNAPNQSDSSF